MDINEREIKELEILTELYFALTEREGIDQDSKLIQALERRIIFEAEHPPYMQGLPQVGELINPLPC